ncbi:MAG: glycosyltransferase family 39 protein [Pseudomonadota bacterium]
MLLRRRATDLLFVAVLIGTTTLHLKLLDHVYIHKWDEQYHLAVAQSLTLDFFKPRLQLIDASGSKNPGWSDSTIWMHKPILPSWMSAISVKLGGRQLFFYRLPSVCFFVLLILTVRALGTRVHSVPLGNLAASLLALNPFLVRLTQGDVFSDMFDLPLQFFSTASVLALIHAQDSRRPRLFALAGVLCGLGVLSKAFLGLSPLGVAVLLTGLGRTPVLGSGPRLRDLAIMAGAFVVTILPINLWLLLQFTDVFLEENVYFLRHLTHGLEVWALPWDYPFNGVWKALFSKPLALLGLCGVGALSWRMVRTRNVATLSVGIWCLLTLAVFLVSKTKPPVVFAGCLPTLTIGIGLIVFSSARFFPLGLGLATSAILLDLGLARGTLFEVFNFHRYPGLKSLVHDAARDPTMALNLSVFAPTFLLLLAVFAVLTLARRRGFLGAFTQGPALATGCAVCVGLAVVGVTAHAFEAQRVAIAGKKDPEHLRMKQVAAQIRPLLTPEMGLFVEHEGLPVRLAIHLDNPVVGTPRQPSPELVRKMIAFGFRPLYLTSQELPYTDLRPPGSTLELHLYDLQAARPLP